MFGSEFAGLAPGAGEVPLLSRACCILGSGPNTPNPSIQAFTAKMINTHAILPPGGSLVCISVLILLACVSDDKSLGSVQYQFLLSCLDFNSYTSAVFQLTEVLRFT